MKNDVLIRPMESSEATHVASLAAVIIKPLSYYSQKARASELSEYTAESLRKKVKNDVFSILVAESESELVGFVFSKWDSGTIWLEWIGVHKKYRRKGVAHQLLQALEKTVRKRNAHKIWCDCRTANTASKKLLAATGYQQLVTIPHHWFNQDYILWHKQIR